MAKKTSVLCIHILSVAILRESIPKILLFGLPAPDIMSYLWEFMRYTSSESMRGGCEVVYSGTNPSAFSYSHWFILVTTINIRIIFINVKYFLLFL